MKRAGYLFDQIVSCENLQTAWLKARRHKSSKKSVIHYQLNVEKNLEELRKRLTSGDFKPKNYHQFKIHDPKERTISVVPFEERVLHHAIINVLEPVFEKQFIYHTYACRKNKGVHKAVKELQNAIRKNCMRNSYYIKLDVKKYFDSIDHRILKQILTRTIKDGKCLSLLFSIIDSYSVDGAPGKGLPIGNLTSQFFANLYLSGFDHYITERLHVCAYFRYMDDMIVLCRDYGMARSLMQKISRYFEDELILQLKMPVINRCRNGIAFLGRLIRPVSVVLLAAGRKRKIRKLADRQCRYMEGRIREETFLVSCRLILNERLV